MTNTEIPEVSTGLREPAEMPPRRAGTTIITKHFTFEAAHFLPNVPEHHKCRRMHGHGYQTWIHVTGEVDDSQGWIVDFADIKRLWKRLEIRLDHQVLNEVPGLENPTAECLAAWIWSQFEGARQEGVAGFRVAAVEVAETADSRAMFIAPGRTPWIPGHPPTSLPSIVEASSDSIRPLVSHEFPTDVVTSHLRADQPPPAAIEDVQSRADDRGIALDEVGVTRVRVPIDVLDRDRGRQTTVAHVTMGANLPAEVKGTHLSRFLQALRDHRDAFTLFSLSELTAELRDRLHARRVRVRVEFPYFITKAAPVTGELGNLDVDCVFEIIDEGGDLEHWLQVATPITTVCPCSRDISDYGAHNQRGNVTTRIHCTEDEAGLPALVWIEELIELAEAAASSPVYPIVKRVDERHMTMMGYDNPKFVEDVARNIFESLTNDARVKRFEIRVENDESIHSHNAYVFVASAHGECISS